MRNVKETIMMDSDSMIVKYDLIGYLSDNGICSVSDIITFFVARQMFWNTRPKIPKGTDRTDYNAVSKYIYREQDADQYIVDNTELTWEQIETIKEGIEEYYMQWEQK